MRWTTSSTHPNVAPFIFEAADPEAGDQQSVAGLCAARGARCSTTMAPADAATSAAVVRAILLDAEARPASTTATPPVAPGKVKEPLLRLTQFWRAYGARSASGTSRRRAQLRRRRERGLRPGAGTVAVGVQFLQSRAMRRRGRCQAQGMVAPELQLATEYLNTQVTNYFWTQANLAHHHAGARRSTSTTCTSTPARRSPLATDSEALVNRVAERLLGGAASMSARAQGAGQGAGGAVHHRQHPRRRCHLSDRCLTGVHGATMNTPTPQVPESRRGRRHRLCLRPHSRHGAGAGCRRRRLRRLQGAGVRVPVRRQRLLEHGRAHQHGRVQRLFAFARRRTPAWARALRSRSQSCCPLQPRIEPQRRHLRHASRDDRHAGPVRLGRMRQWSPTSGR